MRPHVRSPQLLRPRYLSVLLAIALVVVTAAPAGSLPASRQQTKNVAAVPGVLKVADVSGLSAEQQLTFTALQGIVNRDAPRLYLTGLRMRAPVNFDPSNQAWLDDAVPMATQTITPAQVLTTFLPDVKGLVVWDPAVPFDSQNLATTIAGAKDFVPIGPDQILSMTALGYTVKQDLRDLHLTTPRAVVEWTLDHVTPPPGGWTFPEWIGHPRNAFAVQPANRDWAVAHRALVFDLDPATDQALLQRILGLFPPGTPVYGYLFFDTPMYQSTGLAINEPIAVSAITEAGLRLVPSDDAANMTVFEHFNDPVQPALWDATPRTPDDNMTYVSFIVSDGDNLGYNFSLMRNLQTDRLNATSIPIGLSISLELSRVAPTVWNYYVTHLPSSARLIAGPSGDGYVLPMSMTDGELDAYLDRTHTAMASNGLQSVWLFNSLFVPSPPPRQIAQYEAKLDPSILYSDYSVGAPTSPVVSFVNGTPSVHVVLAATQDQIVPAIQAAQALQSGPGPKFVAIGLTAWSTNADMAAQAMAQLGPGYEAVAPDTFAGLLRGAHAAGYEGSPDVPRDEPAPVNACVVDFDNARFTNSTYVAGVVSSFAFKDGATLPTKVTIGTNSLTAQLDVSDLVNTAATNFAKLAPMAFERTDAGDYRVDATLSEVTVQLGDGSNVVLSGSALATADQDTPAVRQITTLGGANPMDDSADVQSLDANLRVHYSYDPGDGPQSATMTVPVRCTPTVKHVATPPTVTNPHQPAPPQPSGNLPVAQGDSSAAKPIAAQPTYAG